MGGRLKLIDAEIRLCKSQLFQISGDNVRLASNAATLLNDHDSRTSIIGDFREIDAHARYNVRIGNILTVRVLWKNLITDIDKEKQFNLMVKMTAFRNWCMNFDPKLINEVDFTKIIIHDVDFAGQRVLFLKFSTDMKYKKPFIEEYERKHPSKTIPVINDIVFMRGGSVAILVILKCVDGTKYSILTKQTRIPIGKMDFEEIPAGMLDSSGDFIGVAAKELEEEAGISIKNSDLIDLLKNGTNSSPTYPSPGGCDESMHFFLYAPEKRYTEAEITAMNGIETGAHEEGEVITLKVIRLDDLREKTNDMKTMTALYLYDKKFPPIRVYED